MADKLKKLKKLIKNLWNSFKSEINDNDIECLYSTDKPQDICHCCENILMINDEGFLNCSNKTWYCLQRYTRPFSRMEVLRCC